MQEKVCRNNSICRSCKVAGLLKTACIFIGIMRLEMNVHISLLNVEVSILPGTNKAKMKLLSRVIDVESQISVFLSGRIADNFIFQLENFLLLLLRWALQEKPNSKAIWLYKYPLSCRREGLHFIADIPKQVFATFWISTCQIFVSILFLYIIWWNGWTEHMIKKCGLLRWIAIKCNSK